MPTLHLTIFRCKMGSRIDESTLERGASAWHVTRSLGKLHRLLKYILASPQRLEEFGEVKGGRKVIEFDHLGVS